MDVLQSIGTHQRTRVETDQQVNPATGEWFEVLDGFEQVSAPEIEVEASSEPVLFDPEAGDEVVATSDDDAPSEEKIDIKEPIPQSHTVSLQEHATTSKWDLLSTEKSQEDLDLLSPVREVRISVKDDDTILDVSSYSQISLEPGKMELHANIPFVQTFVPVSEALSGEIKLRPDFRQSDREVPISSAVMPLVWGKTDIGGNSGLVTNLISIVQPKELGVEQMRLEVAHTEGQNIKSEAAVGSVLDVPTEHSEDAEPMVRTQVFGDRSMTAPLAEGPKNALPDTAAKSFDQIAPVSVGLSPSNSSISPPQIMQVAVRDQPVLLQVAQAIEATETGTIELRLDPAELGKVRITMVARDGIMLATIAVERPETLELLRRNSDSLDMTFSEQGFGETVLDFQQFDQNDGRNDDVDEQAFGAGTTELSDMRPTRLILQQSSDGLDIRL